MLYLRLILLSLTLPIILSANACPNGEYFKQGTTECIQGIPNTPSPNWLPFCSNGRLIQGSSECNTSSVQIPAPGLYLPNCNPCERLIQGTTACGAMPNYPPIIIWDRTISKIDYDYFYSIETDSQGNIYAVGSTDDSSVMCALFFKFDINGTKIWEKDLGCASYASFESILIDNNDTIYLGGYLTLGDGWQNGWIVKLDKDANVIWNKTYQGSVSTKDYEIYGLTMDSKGNVYGAGFLNGNGNQSGWILKVDKDGTKVWNRTIGGTHGDFFSSISIDVNNSIYVAGYSSSTDGNITDGNNGSRDALIVKLDSDGNLVWDRTIGGTTDEIFNDVIIDMNSNIYAVGYTNSSNGDITDGNNGNWDALIVKLDSNGNLVWDRTIGGSSKDIFYDIEIGSNAGLYAVGASMSNDFDVTDGNNGSMDALIVKLDSDGSLLWDRTIGGSNSDYFYSFILDENCTCYSAGYSRSDDGDITDGFSNGYDALLMKLKLQDNALKNPDI